MKKHQFRIFPPKGQSFLVVIECINCAQGENMLKINIPDVELHG